MSELASPQPGSTSHASIRRTLYGVSALLAVCVVAIVGWKVVRMYRAHQFVAELIRRSAGEVRITHRHPEWFNKTIDEWNGGPVFLHGIDTVESVDLVDDDDLSSRLERLSLLPELEALWIEGPVADPRAWRGLSELTNLRTLDVRSGESNRRAAAGIGRMTRLETLRIPALDQSPDPALNPAAREWLADDDLATWSGLAQLTEVDLSGHPITGRGLRALAGCRGLKKLKLTDCPIDDAGAAALASLDALEELDLGGTQVTDAGLAFLERLSSLRFLRLARTPVEGHGLEHLHADAPLELLDLADSPANDSIWRVVARTTTLLCLDLHGTSITGEGMDSLSKEHHPLGLEWIDLAGTVVDDSSLRHLSGLPRLAELSLSRTLVSGSGFRQMLPGVPIEDFPPNFPALIRLSLRGAAVTDEGLVDLSLSDIKTLRDLDVAETRIAAAALLSFHQKHETLARLDFSATPVIVSRFLPFVDQEGPTQYVSDGWTDVGSNTSVSWVCSPSGRWQAAETSRRFSFTSTISCFVR